MARPVTSPNDAQSLLKKYDRGIFTKLEVISELILAAATCPPTQLATALSNDWLDAIKEHTSSPPKSRSDVIWISGGIYRAGFEGEREQHEEKMKQWCFDGTWNWHRCFFEQQTAADRGS